jgi:hypothetical protein
MPAAEAPAGPDDQMVPLLDAARIAYAHISGATERRTDDDLRLVCLALSAIAPVYLGIERLDAREAQARLTQPHAALERLRMRRRDLRAATSQRKESLLLSALRLAQSRAALACSRRSLSGHP